MSRWRQGLTLIGVGIGGGLFAFFTALPFLLLALLIPVGLSVLIYAGIEGLGRRRRQESATLASGNDRQETLTQWDARAVGATLAILTVLVSVAALSALIVLKSSPGQTFTTTCKSYAEHDLSSDNYVFGDNGPPWPDWTSYAKGWDSPSNPAFRGSASEFCRANPDATIRLTQRQTGW